MKAQFTRSSKTERRPNVVAEITNLAQRGQQRRTSLTGALHKQMKIKKHTQQPLWAEEL